MPRENTLMALVDDQVEIVHFNRIAVPMTPKQFDGFKRQIAGFEIPHERAAENFVVPARVHATFDLTGKSFRLGGRKLFTDLES